MRYTLIIAALALAGCAQIPADPTRMSSEQLKEFVKDKNATISCVIANNPYGRVVAKYVNLDKSVIVDGLVTVGDDCQVTITNTPKAGAPRAEPEARAGRESMNCYPGNASGSLVVCERR